MDLHKPHSPHVTWVDATLACFTCRSAQQILAAVYLVSLVCWQKTGLIIFFRLSVGFNKCLVAVLSAGNALQIHDGVSQDTFALRL